MPAVPDKCVVGDVLPGNYIVKQPLGQGGYGYVCYAQKDDQDYAVKVQGADRSAYTEVSLLTVLNHPNIVKPVETLYVPLNPADIPTEPNALSVFGHFYIYEPKGSGDIPAGVDILKVVFDLLSALAYLEQNGILHCDIKPANVVFIGDKPVLIDFGLAQFCPGSDRMGEFLHSQVEPRPRFQIQTTWFRAPEVWREEAYDARIDVFSLGCCLYKWLSGNYLFTSNELGAYEVQLVEMPGRVAKLVDKLGRDGDPRAGLYNQLFIGMLTYRQERLFASQLLKMMYGLSLPPPGPSSPPSWQYPYPNDFKIPDNMRTEVMFRLNDQLHRSGVLRKIPRQANLEFTDDNLLTTSLSAEEITSRELNNSAWTILAFTVVEQLFGMAASRSTFLSGFIPGGAGRINEQTYARAINIAVYLVASFANREVYSAPLEVANTLAEFYQYSNYCLYPKILLTKHDFMTDQAFVNSVSAKVIPIYLDNLASIKWTTLDEKQAKTTLKLQAGLPA